MGKNNNQSLEPNDSKVPEDAAFDPQNRKFETFEEEEKKSSDDTEKSNKTVGDNDGTDINLAMGQAEHEGHSLDSSSLLRFNRSNHGEANNETSSNSFGAPSRLSRLNGIGGVRQSLSRSQTDNTNYFGGLNSTMRNQSTSRSTNFTGNLGLPR